MTDEQLMQRVQNGENKAFSELVDRYKGKIMAFVAAYCGWDMAQAEEITQQSLIKLYENRQKYVLDRPFKPWLFTLARNQAIDLIRSRKKNISLSSDLELAQPGASVEEQAWHRERVERLISATDSLPNMQRETVHLVRQGMSYGEISQILEISEAAVRQNYSRAVRRLRELFREAR